MAAPCVTSVARRRRWWIVAVVGVLLAAGWLAVRALQVHGALREAQAVLTRAAADPADTTGLRQAQRAASADVRVARRAVDDPLWRLAAEVPVTGRSFRVARDATIVVGQLVDGAMPPLVASGEALRARPLLSSGTVDLQLLDTVALHLTEADAAVAAAQERTKRMPERLLPAPVADARARLGEGVDRLATALGAGRQAFELAPAALGAKEPRRYFLAVQNNAEVRGTGGLVGAYAVLRADDGRLSLDRVGTNLDFRTAEAPVVDLGPEFSARYDAEFARSYWSAAVLTPDWPSASAIMAALWREQGGGEVDGVLGVDPVAMADLLGVTGPAQVGARIIGADNVVDFVMRDEYAEFSDDSPERKQVLSQLAAALYAQVAEGGYDAPAMLSAVAGAAGSGHLQLWFARPQEQVALKDHRVAGALPGRPGDYLQVVSNNAAGNKADYYVRRRVSYVRTGEGQADVTVELSNTVEPSAVPPIVIGRLDDPPFEVEPGQTRQLLSIYVGVGELVERVLVDCVEASADIGTERGHGVATVLVEIRPSRPTVVVAEVTDAGGSVAYRQQPLVVDDELDLRVPHTIG
jgi:hypothetical protein